MKKFFEFFQRKKIFVPPISSVNLDHKMLPDVNELGRLVPLEDGDDDALLVLPSSGTSRQFAHRWVVQSQKKFMNQAQAVVDHFSIEGGCRWGLFIPAFHVGGLALKARAWLTQGEVIDCSQNKWDPIKAVELIKEYDIAYISWVPTQLFDVVQKGLEAPSRIKRVFIGGARLEASIEKRAEELGWPLIVTYGMTETNAFFAYRRGGVSSYQVLPQYEIKIEGNHLWIRSPLLFKGYWEQGCFLGKQVDDEGFWLAPDLVDGNNGHFFRVIGRSQEDYFKCGGRGFSASLVCLRLAEWFQKNHLLLRWEGLVCEDQRLGNLFCLVLDKSFAHYEIPLVSFLKEAFPGLKFRLHFIEEGQWPTTPSGKVHLAQLKQSICQQV
ncbi:MAG: AMP-binding protein [Bdellovibrionaceae bacterium]|nr:AMP-binding protein [Pseudobdellovibrionaceae bacterium]MDW8191086.1 AMP-binding protein [Pseudobdellovibrionaceae bacterium]